MWDVGMGELGWWRYSVVHGLGVWVVMVQIQIIFLSNALSILRGY